MGLARLIDERGGLRESLSTAVWIERSGEGASRLGEWGGAAVRDAERVSERVSPRSLVGVRVPRGWWAAPVLAGLFFVVGVFPEGGLLATFRVGSGVDGTGQVEEAVQDTEAALEEARDELREAASGSPEARELLERLEDPTLEELKSDPERYRREVMKRLSEARLGLEEMSEGAEASSVEAAKKKLMSMRVPASAQDPDMASLAKALQRGDLSAAQRALSALQEKLASGELTDEEMEQLAKAMEELAEELEAAAQRNSEMEEALRRAGIDPSLADDPEALREAIENAEGLSERQKQQLQKAANANRAANERLKEAAGACRQCAGGGSKSGGQSGASGSGAQQMAEGMSRLGSSIGGMQGSAERAASMRAAANAMQRKMRAMGGGASGGSRGEQRDLSGMFAGEAREPSPFDPPPEKHQQPGVQGIAEGGSGRGQGGGSGAGGRGAGSSGGAGLADRGADPNEVDLESDLADSIYGEGPVVGTEFVDADGVMIPESRAALAEIVADAERSALESSASNDRVFPAEYHDAIRAYFERLNGRVRGGGEGGDGGGEE
jgi:hypothetical protein